MEDLIQHLKNANLREVEVVRHVVDEEKKNLESSCTKQTASFVKFVIECTYQKGMKHMHDMYAPSLSQLKNVIVPHTKAEYDKWLEDGLPETHPPLLILSPFVSCKNTAGYLFHVLCPCFIRIVI